MDLNKIELFKIKKIKNINGDILHGLKFNDPGFIKFREIYFSRINFNKIKAWKKHKKISMNLIVPYGNVMFIFYDDKKNKFRKEIIGEKRYKRLFVPPNIIFGFKGLSKPYSLISNVIDYRHDPSEAEKIPKNKIIYKW